MNKLSISVVIPTFNRAQVVGDAIKSVLSQSVSVDEIIVVDDGSTDNTAEVLAEFGNQIILISQPNSGVSAARNAGVHRAKSEWIAFLDSDDLWLPNRIAILQRDLVAGNFGVHVANLVITGPGYSRELFELRGFKNREPSPTRYEDGFEIAILDPFHSGLAVRRDWILKAGGYDATIPFCEDIDLLFRMIFFGPWMANGTIVGNLRRIDSREDPLSLQGQRNRVLGESIKLRIYERLLRLLSPNTERALLVRRIVSRCLFNSARALNKTGRHIEARAQLLYSAREHPTLKGWLRAIPPLLMGSPGYKLLELVEPTKFFRDKD